MRVARHLRLDAELVRRGLVASRAEARKAIEAGLVEVNGVRAEKVATMVGDATPLALAGPPSPFVSRGGVKLDGALERFHLDVAGRRWLDAGASTGGFTDCLLQRGASHVVAVDVGYGQLDWKLRNDERVTVIERVNVRDLAPAILPWRPEGVVADLSFISLRLVMPALIGAAADDADIVVMVKPQFEVGRDAVGSGGVVRDPELWRSAVTGVIDRASELGVGTAGVVASELPGPAGNREFFVWLRRDGGSDLEVVDVAIAEAAAGESGRMQG